MKSKKYPNLAKPKWSPNWVFRKYSAAKKAEFSASTGIEATEANAARAYQVGLDKFNDWMGVHLAHGRQPLIRDLARVVLAGKQSKAPATALKNSMELRLHVLPSLGHLKPADLTPLRLIQFEHEERMKGRKILFNTRKVIMEILRRARDEGLIRTVPTWKVSDPAPAPPRFIDAQTFRSIRRLAIGPERLVLFILYHQGARPSEVCQYRWEMIRWKGHKGFIDIPGHITKTRRARTIPLNSRVARVLYRIKKRSGPIFPRQQNSDQSRVVYDRQWLDAVKALGLSYQIYNLRDSWITRKLSEGISSIFVAKYVDTSAKMLDTKYAVTTEEILKKLAG